MRWSQGRWSEDRLTQAVNATKSYYAIPSGPRGTAPRNDLRAFELYFERLGSAGMAKIKRPDVLVFDPAGKDDAQKSSNALGGRIVVESGMDKGTVFRTIFPEAKGVIAETNPVSEAVVASGRRARILVVDDEPILATQSRGCSRSSTRCR